MVWFVPGLVAHTCTRQSCTGVRVSACYPFKGTFVKIKTFSLLFVTRVGLTVSRRRDFGVPDGSRPESVVW